MSEGSRFSPTVVLTLLGALAVGFAYVSMGLSGGITSVEAEFSILNDKFAEFQAKHDREVILINTSNSAGIEVNAGNLCILWKHRFPTSPCPVHVKQPRIDP